MRFIQHFHIQKGGDYMIGGINGYSNGMGIYTHYAVPVDKISPLSREDQTEALKALGKTECETCKSRKYQDGSDEMVSFKSAAHISPEAAASRVRSHEQEHVSNAYKKASQDNGKVLSTNVSIKTSICPECGRSYVAGGETRTQIKYYNEDNPYQQDKKSTDGLKYIGMNINAAC